MLGNGEVMGLCLMCIQPVNVRLCSVSDHLGADRSASVSEACRCGRGFTHIFYTVKRGLHGPSLCIMCPCAGKHRGT